MATWNVGHRTGAWDRVLALDVDLALLQELPRPSEHRPGSTVFEPFEGNRRWGTGIWSRSLHLEPLPPTTSRSVPLTLQGAVAAAEANLPGGGKLTVFSVHGVAENIATGRASPPGFSLTMMQRFITDLTGYLHEMRKRGRRGSGRNITIFGGDFNCSLGWDGKQGYASHGPMFDRLAGFGLRSVLPIRPDNEYTTCIRARIPFRQLDYLFISENARWSNPQIVDSELTRAAEDHLPVVVDLA